MNEETILETHSTANEQQDTKKEGSAWKQVTLGGVSGILMGGGLLYAGQTYAADKEDAFGHKPEDVVAPEPRAISHTLENGLKIASVSDDMSFGEAFAAARAEVGPGGVFHWHGGIYNTYTADEWNNMSVEQKNDFVQLVQPEIRVWDQQTVQNFEQDADVHIVGYANVDGHLAVGYDTSGDGQADVAIIDVDDNHELSDADIIIDNQGNAATVGEVVNDNDPNQLESVENPDVAPDMPDYMNDAMLDI